MYLSDGIALKSGPYGKLKVKKIKKKLIEKKQIK